MGRGRPKECLAGRILSKITYKPDTGCLEWTGSRDLAGYGKLMPGSRMAPVPVHRFLWEGAYGPLGKNRLHQKCENRACCRLDHIEVVEKREATAPKPRLSDCPALSLLHKMRWNAETSCLEWTGAKVNGYGMWRGKVVHRVMWEAANGPMPDGWQNHHTCHNRACCNIAHLNSMPKEEHWAIHTPLHCPQGHAYSKDNSYRTKEGQRGCKLCRREIQKKWRERNPDYHRLYREQKRIAVK